MTLAETGREDSPNFSSALYMQHLITNSSLAQLLRASTTLSAAIADLEGERQSLVYNHHHELIDASITISKMKVRAESLDTTLEQLKARLAQCAELESGLRQLELGYSATATVRVTSDGTATTPGTSVTDALGHQTERQSQSQAQSHSDSTAQTAAVPLNSARQTIDWPLVLGTIIDLPMTLEAAGKEEALRLWGTYEPVLRKWKQAGVQGIDEVEGDCRDVLARADIVDVDPKASRRRSASPCNPPCSILARCVKASIRRKRMHKIYARSATVSI